MTVNNKWRVEHGYGGYYLWRWAMLKGNKLLWPYEYWQINNKIGAGNNILYFKSKHEAYSKACELNNCNNPEVLERI